MEEWKDIPGYEGIYRISEGGKIQRIAANQGAQPGRIMKARIRPDGFQKATLTVNNTPKEFLVHCLVMLAFAGECPPGMWVKHRDGDRKNNHLSNLEYATRGEVFRHAAIVRKSYQWAGSRSYKYKRLGRVLIHEIRALAKSGVKQRELARRFHVSESVVSCIVSGKIKGIRK